MRALKALLVIMGVIIFAGFGFIAWEVYKRATDPNHPRSFAKPAPAAGTAPAGAAALPSSLPAGSRIGPMVESNGRVVFHVTLPDGREQLHVLDPRAGTSLLVVQTGDSMGQATNPAR